MFSYPTCWCSPGLCAGPGFICHRHGLVAGQDCWILLDWGGVWPELHWSLFCWWCLSPCWNARAYCCHIGDNGKWGSTGLEVNRQKTKVQALGCREDMPLTIKVQGHDVMVVEDFVYLGCHIHSTNGSNCDISRRSPITRAAMQSLENQIWRSRLAISTKLKLQCTTCASYQYSCMVRTAERYQRWMHVGSIHSTSGVCVC